MSPLEQAASVYDREPCARSFREDVEAHFVNGHVISTPDVFILAREVSRGATPEQIVNPWIAFPPHLADCWHVYLFAGDLRRVFDYCPSAKKWVAFERGNILRFHRFESIRRWITCPTFPFQPDSREPANASAR